MKKSGKLVNSTSGIKVTVTTVTVKSKNGKEHEFIRINTDGKRPSQTVVNGIKLHGGSWYNQDQTWSIYNSAKNQRFVNKVILKDCFKVEEEKVVEVKTSKPNSKAKGKAKTTNSIEDRVDCIEKQLAKIIKMLSK